MITRLVSILERPINMIERLILAYTKRVLVWVERLILAYYILRGRYLRLSDIQITTGDKVDYIPLKGLVYCDNVRITLTGRDEPRKQSLSSKLIIDSEGRN